MTGGLKRANNTYGDLNECVVHLPALSALRSRPSLGSLCPLTSGVQTRPLLAEDRGTAPKKKKGRIFRTRTAETEQSASTSGRLCQSDFSNTHSHGL